MKRALIFCALLVAGIAGEVCLALNRPGRSPLASETMSVALGGLKSMAAEAVWFRADRLQDAGKFEELAQLADLLTELEPHEPEVWRYAAWNLAYNVSVLMPTPEDRWHWVKAALSLIRDRGLKLNPEKAVLYRELAWMFELKIGGDLDTAAPVYRREWKKTVQDVAARGAWHELGMNEKTMNEVMRLYGVADWSDPVTSAIYWAHLGLPYAEENGSEHEWLVNIINYGRMILKRRAEKKV